MPLPFDAIARLAVRTADLEATAAAYSAFFGVAEWQVRERVARGEAGAADLAYASAIGQAGPVGFELIVPRGEADAYADAFADRGPGISHVVVEVDAPGALAAQLRALKLSSQRHTLPEGTALHVDPASLPGHLGVCYVPRAPLPAPERVLRFDTPAVLPVQQLYQVSVIVPDLGAARARLQAVLGIEAWVEFPLESGPGMPEPRYYGRVVEHAARIAIGRRAGACIELVQPVSGPTVYRDALERHGETPHHIMVTICPPAQFDAAAAQLARRGIVVGQSAAIPTLMQFAYFDASGPMAGLFIEVISPLADDWLARMFPDPALAQIVTG
jgi:methylmalonyl-CoA/ethylmalonyl-CoA epimerase